jgi:hypothetical protein
VTRDGLPAGSRCQTDERQASMIDSCRFFVFLKSAFLASFNDSPRVGFGVTFTALEKRLPLIIIVAGWTPFPGTEVRRGLWTMC